MIPFTNPADARRAVACALAGGELVDVTGDSIHSLPMPVFLTRALWETCIVRPKGVPRFFQSEWRRVEIVLQALSDAVWAVTRRTPMLPAEVPFNTTLRMGRTPRWTTLRLIAVATPGRDGACACLTVMLPDEER